MKLSLSRFGSILVGEAGLVWDDPLRHRQIPLDQQGLEAIRWFADAKGSVSERTRAVEQLGEDLVTALEALEIVLSEVSPRHRRENLLLRSWGEWSTHARMYHFATRVEVGEEFASTAQNRAMLRHKRIEEPPPSRFPHVEANALALPVPGAVPGTPCIDVLRTRRTVRRFAGQPLGGAVLSTLLKEAVGLSEARQRSRGDRDYENFFRSAPSGGARVSTEVYLVARSVRGLPPGGYRYNPLDHTVTPVGRPLPDEELAHALGGQTWFLDCPVLLVYGVDLPSLVWKYPHARAYRVGILDVGHLSQAVLMTATALGLGAGFTAAFRESVLEGALGVDPAVNALAGVCGIGHPWDNDPQTQGLHE